MESPFSSDDLESIKQLRERFTDLSEGQATDHFLIKWLRARSMNVSKAEAMLRKSLEWRKQNGVDTILDTRKISEERLKNLPVAYLGHDPVSGCVVILFGLGRYDTRAVIEEIGSDEFILDNVWMMEHMHKFIFPECSEILGRPVTQILELVDLDGYSYRQWADSRCRNTIVRMQMMFDSNYPEVVHHIAFINAPTVFSLMYNFVKPFVAKTTLNKIAIYGRNNWQEAVKKVFPMELIPTHYGGTRPGRDEFCSGDPIWIFGLDKDYFKVLDVVQVPPRDKVELVYDVVEVGARLGWKFKTEGHDISYGILHDEQEVLPITRVDAHKKVQTGELKCQHPGKYTIVFDNTYSYTRGKSIHYRIQILSAFDSVAI